jgi:kynurenine formamidase
VSADKRDDATTSTAPSHRVQFDFEVDFINGGGLQGNDFRLDIDGETISDDRLSDSIIHELRLLMVSEVRVSNKRIIHERHKQTTEPRKSVLTAMERTVDLSHTIEDGMVTYPGLPAPIICDFWSREQSRGLYEPGTEFQFGKGEMCANTGTYLDSPYHRYADGNDISQLPLERLVEIEAVKVDVTGQTSPAVRREQLLPYDVSGKVVLIHTGWDRYWRMSEYFAGHPHLTAEAAKFLVEQKAVLVGIDSLNIDSTDTGARPVHSTLLGAGVPICEHLTNLGGLPVDGFRFTAAPVKIAGMGTFPVRAYATVPATPR